MMFRKSVPYAGCALRRVLATSISGPGARRTVHNMHTVGLLREDLVEISSIHSKTIPVVCVPGRKRPDATSGDYCLLGTDSAEYYCVDTNPESSTEPYENPRMSGKQLRYGGMPPIVKEEIEIKWNGKAQEGSPLGTKTGWLDVD